MPIGGSPGGGQSLPSTRTTVTTAASQTTVAFSAITGSYTHARVVLQARGTTAANTVALTVALNSDGAANYDWQYIRAAATVLSSFITRGDTSISCGNLAAASGTAGFTGAVVIDFPFYSGSVWQKECNVANGERYGTAADNNLDSQIVRGWWRNTAAITTITFSLSSGAFQDGSVATLDLY